MNNFRTDGYLQKVEVTSYLESIQGDLESRLEAYKGDFKYKETVAERIKTIENHVKTLKISKDFIHELMNDYLRVVKELNEYNIM